MKRIASLSTIQSLPGDSPSSYQLIDLFNSTRSHNVEQQITGAFIISDKLLLMIIEGDATHLANIIFTLRQDKRLKDFSLIMNADIEKPEFTSWGIKLVRQDNEAQTRFFEKINYILQNNVDVKSRLDEQRLDMFLNSLHSSKTSTHSEHTPTITRATVKDFDIRNATISLSGWPKPGKIRLTPELIKICARLVGRPQHFEDLLNANIAASEQSLITHLTALKKLELLRNHGTDGKPRLVSIKGGLSSSGKPSSTDRFSMVLRNFLSAQKQ